MIISRSMAQADDKALLSSLLSSGHYTQVPEGEARVRRRRRRSKGDSTEAKKRRLSAEQVKFLEINFGLERKLDSGRKVHLASELGLDPKQVAVWFQNRRARWKCKQLEEEYAKLKMAHETVVVEKCHLEAEVLKLKDQLSEAERKTKRHSGSSIEGTEVTGSPSSSFSMATQQPFFGELGVGGNEALMHIQEYNNYVSMMDWINLYGM